MDTLPFELNKEISKKTDVNIIRLVNKQFCLANMDRFCNHIIEKLNVKHIDYLYDHYNHPFVINRYDNNTYYIKYNDNHHIYYMYESNYLPNQRKHNKTYRAGTFLSITSCFTKVQIRGIYELDLLSYDYLMTVKGCDKQSRINKLKDILTKQYQLTKTWGHEEYYDRMIDDHLWFMTNAKVMKLIDYTYNIFIIDYSKYDYNGEEETHPRVVTEKIKLKTEIDLFYGLISDYLNALNK